MNIELAEEWPEEFRDPATGQAISEAADVPIEQEPLPTVYYDAGARTYLVPNNRGGWVPTNDAGLSRYLRKSGVSPNRPEGAYLSPVEELTSRIQTEQDVVYAGPLAGHKAGPEEICGNRVLVTNSTRLIEPAFGDCEILQQLFFDMLGRDHPQLLHFYGWLKFALESLSLGLRRPGQALVLAGPAASCKSLTQWLITQLFGGREARPYRYMAGATDFNRELFAAEHLVIEDDNPSTDLRARRNFGAKLKELTVNSAVSCHGKNREALSLTPFWRVSISVNDEPENLMMLPPLDESLLDKLILLRVQRPKMIMPTTAKEREEFQHAIIAELPGFVHLLKEWTLPSEFESSRFGVKHYLQRDLVENIDALAPEAKLLDLIDTELFKGPLADDWEGTAAELEHRLTELNLRQAERLFTYSTACGVYLGRLATKLPERIRRARKRGGNYWVIRPVRDSHQPVEG